MIESELYYLVKSYRDAIEQAHKKNRFCKWPFNQFPEACCGQASDILARFLGEQGIYTKVVSGSDSNTTHAWLVLDDSILQKNIQRAEEATDYEEVNKMNRILEGYGYNKEINIYPYCDLDSILRGCTIIDITGSQSQFRLDSKYFNYNIPIYIGEMDDFHTKRSSSTCTASLPPTWKRPIRGSTAGTCATSPRLLCIRPLPPACRN